MMRSAIWLPMVPVGTNTAASFPRRPASSISSSATVGSSPKPSSPTAASAIARRMAADGLVTVSERRSTRSGIGAHGIGPLTSPAVPAAAELVTLARRLAVEAGTLVRQGRPHGVHAVGTKSTATDMVTEYDRQSE